MVYAVMQTTHKCIHCMKKEIKDQRGSERGDRCAFMLFFRVTTITRPLSYLYSKCYFFVIVNTVISKEPTFMRSYI